jgi:hypothetical protein
LIILKAIFVSFAQCGRRPHFAITASRASSRSRTISVRCARARLNRSSGTATSNRSPDGLPVFFSDDGRRYSQVPSDHQLPEIAGREGVLGDEAVAGLGLATADEDVEITLRETATHSIRDLIQDLVLPESATWRAARLSSTTLRRPAFDAVAAVDYRRDIIEASRPLPLRQMLMIAAKFVAALSQTNLVPSANPSALCPTTSQKRRKHGVANVAVSTST